MKAWHGVNKRSIFTAQTFTFVLNKGQHRARKHTRRQHTQSNNAQGLPSDPGSSRGHFPNLLHALYPRAFPQGLVQPGGSPVQVQDVAHGGICCFFYGGGWHVTHGDPCSGGGEHAKQCLLFPIQQQYRSMVFKIAGISTCLAQILSFWL